MFSMCALLSPHVLHLSQGSNAANLCSASVGAVGLRVAAVLTLMLRFGDNSDMETPIWGFGDR